MAEISLGPCPPEYRFRKVNQHGWLLTWIQLLHSGRTYTEQCEAFEWAIVNGGKYLEHRDMVLIKDPNLAFEFKLRWL
jgi:hypothetical protein